MLRKLTGIIFLLVGIGGVALAVIGFNQVDNAVDSVAVVINDTMTLTDESLDTVEGSLLLAQTTIDDVNAGLDTVEETAVNLANTLQNTKPLLDQVTVIASQDAPESIEAVQDAIPDVAEVAGVIDDTLIVLNNFRIDENILGIPIQYDLGIDYQPTQPFDETVNELGNSLEGLPTQLRSLEPSLTEASTNLDAVSDNIRTISGDLDTINGRINDIDPLLDEYITIVQEIDSTISSSQITLNTQLNNVKIALKVAMVWLGLMQFAILYIGFDLITRVDRKEIEEMVEEISGENND